MSDAGASPRRVSPTALATYATCPRQYEYDRVWDVSTPEASRRYLDRGLVYHDVIEDVCNEVAERPGMTDEEIREFARERTGERWASGTDRSEYVSDAQYAYDEELVFAAIDDYFGADGLTHVRDSVGTERWLECERNGVALRGRADNVVRTDDGLHVIDYKGSLGGVVSWQSIDSVIAHHNREEYAPDRLKSVFQAATYIEGAKNLPEYEPGMDVEFTFHALLDDTTRERHVDGLQVDVEGRGREVGDIYRAYDEDIWALIADCYEGILAEQYEPERFAEIREEACEGCDYRQMCADYLGAEVRLHEW